MTARTMRLMLVVVGGAFALSAAADEAKKAAAKPMPYPKDYRSWSHVKGMVISDKKHGLYGFHHVYVQPKALAAFKAGKGYAEGATLAVPFYEVKDEGGMVQQGDLKMVAVMKKDKKATETGGWAWAAFGPDEKALELDVKTGCFDCHAPQKDRDYVFAQWAEK